MLKRKPRLILTREEPPAPPAKRSENRKRNRVILRYALLTVLIIDSGLALALGYLFFLHLPYLNLHHVDVIGNRHLSRSEIVEAAEVEQGTNLLTVDLRAITTNLKRHPWIGSAAVYRRFPGQLIIEVEERTPRAILAADKLHYVDQQAEFFTRLLPGDRVDLPLFTGVKPEELQSNGSEIREMIRTGLNLLELMERTGSEMNPNAVAEIRLDLDEGLSLCTRDGRLVVLGKKDLEGKIQRYGRLKKFLSQRGEWTSARIINLDFEDRAVVRWDKARLQG
ncbi:MAG: FtsQ-type POTRA domain-containing protein [Desulfomonile tiedjei]|nr:FtsQ-type POTRA domain-containing protein [Desulfomonile tiedjei]